MIDDFLQSDRIAYFSMEVALRSDIPTYAGGLGILAGDTVRSAADLELPLVTLTLASRQGYFRQSLASTGEQTEAANPWDPASCAVPLGAKVVVLIEHRPIWVGGWLYELEGHMGGRQPVLLLDTDLPENRPDDRQITAHLYGGDAEYRLRQEIVLGIGGVRMLRALGFATSHFHMNEGHSALLTLALLREHRYSADKVRTGESAYDIPRVRTQCSFTTHTPVDAGHDQFPWEMVDRVLGDFVEPRVLHSFGGPDRLNMTRLALNLSEYVNGVARRHAETSRRMFPGYEVRSITNGVHPHTWTAPPFRSLYDRYLPGWCHEPEILTRADTIPDEEILGAHRASAEPLIERVRAADGTTLDPERFTLGFARRMTAYKRPTMLFRDLERLRELGRKWPLQIVVAGKAHPHDHDGKALIVRIHAAARELAGDIPITFLADYDMALAQDLVAGVDLWLNTPQPPLEASGTSGMKAAFNGVPSLSVLDGWWTEGCVEGVTGWAIDDAPDVDAADSLYHKLETRILPMYHDDRSAWVAVMQGAITKNAALFNSHRMMRRYATDAYLG